MPFASFCHSFASVCTCDRSSGRPSAKHLTDLIQRVRGQEALVLIQLDEIILIDGSGVVADIFLAVADAPSLLPKEGEKFGAGRHDLDRVLAKLFPEGVRDIALRFAGDRRER